MPLVTVIFILVAIGVLLYLLNKYGPEFIDAKILRIINIVSVVAVILWLVSLFGVFDSLYTIHVGRRGA